MRIETLLKTNINAVANLQNEMELLKDMIESSLTWDWKMTGQKQVTSNWIDVRREAEKWKNGNKTDNFSTQQTSSSFSYDGKQDTLNSFHVNSMKLFNDASASSDYGISSDNSEDSMIQSYRTKTRGSIQTYF